MKKSSLPLIALYLAYALAILQLTGCEIGQEVGNPRLASHNRRATCSPELLEARAARTIHPQEGPTLEEVREQLLR